MENISYSKISTFDNCPYKFKLIYKDKHFIDSKNIALNFGTLVHFIEESMAKEFLSLGENFKYNFQIDKFINKFIDIFINLDDEENKIFGMKKLKLLYAKDFNERDKNGLNYAEKGNLYLNEGIYRLYNYLIQNPNLRIFGIEKEFNLPYQSCNFHGFIDRIFIDKVTNTLYVEDIKTYSAPLKKSDLTTPLQFVFYALAAENLFSIPLDNIKCAYEIPLCNIKQEAGTKGFISRGIKKIDKLLLGIKQGIMEPKPSPLCFWCPFSETTPNQPEEAKNLCPYFSNWTKDVKSFSCMNEWMGEENHQAILEAFINRKNNIKDTPEKILIKPAIEINPERRFLIRR